MAAFFTLAIAAVVTGCVPIGAMDAEAERSVVEEFFERLSAGDAEGAGELMFDPTFVTPGGLDNDFYSEAMWPENPRVVSVSAGGFAGDAVVTVEYTVRGQDVPRRVDLEVSSFGDGPKIIAWDDSAVRVYDVASTIRINGSRDLEPREYDPLVLLPGIYEFEYGDELGITGLGSVGGEYDNAPFPFEFPVAANEADVADGVHYDGDSLSFESRIREGVTESVEVAMGPEVQPLIDSCTAERLVGPSCPDDLVEVVEQESSPGEIDSASISWVDLGVSLTPLDEEWVAVQQFVVEFERGGVPKRGSVVFAGTVGKDASGQFVVTIDPTLDLR